jgi:hypothetical protein
MFKKSIIAVAAIAAAVSFSSVSAKADTSVSIGFGFGVGGFDPGYDYPGADLGPDPFFDEDFGHGRRRHGWHRPRPVMDYGMSCGRASNVVRAAGFRHVRAIDCSAPTYTYKAMRHGDVFKVRVNFRGEIVAVRPIY